MYAVIHHLRLTIPVEQVRSGLEREGAPRLARQPGFRGLYVVQEADDWAAVIVLWNSAVDAADSAAVFGPTWFDGHFAAHLAHEPRRSKGEVLVHR